jgi:hypothetical protein
MLKHRKRVKLFVLNLRVSTVLSVLCVLCRHPSGIVALWVLCLQAGLYTTQLNRRKRCAFDTAQLHSNLAISNRIDPEQRRSRSSDKHAFTKTTSSQTPEDIQPIFNVHNFRSVLFWVITQRIVVITYRRFGTSYRPHLHRSIHPRRRASFLDFLTFEVRTDRFSRNVRKKLPLYAV